MTVIIASHIVHNPIAISVKCLNGYGRVRLYSKKEPLPRAIIRGENIGDRSRWYRWSRHGGNFPGI